MIQTYNMYRLVSLRKSLYIEYILDFIGWQILDGWDSLVYYGGYDY
jgi:hypothetical protein